jgi:WD40 repeat protein
VVDAALKASVWTLSLADGRTNRLNARGSVRETKPQFAFDDRAIYWAGMTQNANGRIWKTAVSADTHEPFGPPEPVFAYDGLMDGLSIARDGSVVYGLYSEDSNLWSIAVRSGAAADEPVRLTHNQRSFRANYSADGRIAYVRTESGTPLSAWTMKEDGTDQQPLVTDFPAFMPQWVRGQPRLLVMEMRGMEANTLRWVDASTRRTTSLALDIRDATEPRISPDGNELAFYVIEPNGAIQVWTQPVTGVARRRITSENVPVSYPNWSPDGKWLSVEITRGSDTQAGVVSSQGGRVEQLTNDRGQTWPNTWSPDNEWIAFAGERANVWNTWTVSRRTHEEHQLTQFKSASGYVRWPAWSPRGDRIVFERDIWTGNVWMTKLP